MYLIYIITAIAVLVSFWADARKTGKALKIALRKIRKILPSFLMMLILVSVIFYLLPDEVISKYLGSENKTTGMLFASVLGSLTLMPGFIAFPMCGILLEKGVTFMVLSGFSTTLMMVGIVTYPIEKAYFGVKVTVLRNVLSLVIALIIAVVTGICFKEISL